MRAASTVSYHLAILSNWPVRSTKWANLAGWIGCDTGASRRIGANIVHRRVSLRAQKLKLAYNTAAGAIARRRCRCGPRSTVTPKPLLGVIRLAAVEEALQGCEMVLAGRLAAIARRCRHIAARYAPRYAPALPSTAARSTSRKAAPGRRARNNKAGHRPRRTVLPAGEHAVIGHHQHGPLRSHDPGQPLAFGPGPSPGRCSRRHRRSCRESRSRVLAEAARRGSSRRASALANGMWVCSTQACLRDQPVDRRVNAEGRALDLPPPLSTAPS